MKHACLEETNSNKLFNLASHAQAITLARNNMILFVISSASAKLCSAAGH
jgi:hypothetical protein